MVPYATWAPTGSAAAALGLTDTWSLTAGYQRRYSTLQTVSSELYANDAAYLTAGGRLSRRAGLNVGATFASGGTILASGVDDSYRIYGASVDLTVELSSMSALTATCFYYRQDFSNPIALPVGVPARYNRTAFRVGLTFFVPLAGSPKTGPRLPDEW